MTPYKICLLGLRPIQRTIIYGLCSLSKRREFVYAVSESDDITVADAVLIDTNDQDVIGNWSQLTEILAGTPCIFIGDQPFDQSEHCLRRSELATDLLPTLDKLVAAEQGVVGADRYLMHDDENQPPGNDSTDPQQAASPRTHHPAAGMTRQASASTAEETPQSRASETSASDLIAGFDALSENTVPDFYVNPVIRATPSPPHETNTADTAAVSASKSLEVDKSQATASESDGNNQADRHEARTISERRAWAVTPAPRTPVIEARTDPTGASAGAFTADDPVSPPIQTALSRDGRDQDAAAAPVTHAAVAEVAPVVTPPSSTTTPADPATAGRDEVTETGAHQSDESDQLPANDAALRILVCDDSKIVWTQMKVCLDGLDADLEFTETAEEALQHCRTKKYSLVFMDVMLPGMDGYHACKAIKTNDVTRHIPVVMLTSKDSPANKVRGVMSGCDYYLTKPVNQQEVSAVVSRLGTIPD